MKIGVVINPNSGRGKINEDLLKAFALKVKDQELYSTLSTFIHIRDFLKIKVIGSEIIYGDYRDSVNAGKSLSCAVDLIVFFGGDGTAVDIIVGMKEENKLIPLAGVATGTACCGPFITFRSVEDLINFDFTGINPSWVRGLNVYSNNQFLGTSFIDVVIGDTLVSTVDGEKRTVAAYDFYYYHKRVIKKPGYIELAGSSVIVNQKNIPLGKKLSQIIISPFSDREKNYYLSKAVTGLFCHLPYSTNSYGMIISSEPIIFFMEDNSLPYCSELKQIIFSQTDLIYISNFDAFCIIDGNPKIDLKQSEVCIKGEEHSGLTIKLEA